MMYPTLTVLDDKLITQIVAEAQRILDEIGIAVGSEALRTRLLDAGLKQDADSERVLFPAEVVEHAIASAPHSFTLYDRKGQPYVTLGDDTTHFVPGSSALKVLDYATGRARPAATEDFIQYVHVADGLPNIAYLATAFSTCDVAPEVADAHRLSLCLTHSTKPVVSGAFTAHGVPRMAAMMQCFRHDRADLSARPMAIFTITPTGLFHYNATSCQNLLDCLAWGVPIEIVPVTSMGLLAPVTPIGACVMHIADVLAGLTMAQLIKPGAPVLFGGAPTAFHMRTGTAPMAAVEALRLDVAYVAVAKALDLPTQAYMALSDAKALDAQAGAETFSSALLAALAGVDTVSGPGLLDYALTFSLEKLVFDDEVCGQALHFARAFTPQDDLPTLDLARQLLAEQTMLTHAHTLAHWRDALYLPGPVIERLRREDWIAEGRTTLHQRAHAEVERRLAAYQPVEVDAQVKAELQRLASAEDL
jgi:trimethylamine--corrinoid protein Co-methyltransferase